MNDLRTHQLSKLYLIADRKTESFEMYLNRLNEAFKAGIQLVQYRHKMADSKTQYEEALALMGLATVYGVKVIINDRVDIALAVNADGVHVGQSDLPVYKVRELLGENAIIGATCKTALQFDAAKTQGANYIGTGAYYSTSTKPEAQLIPHATLEKLIKNTTLPVYGIGGIEPSNIGQVMSTGTYGIAVASSILDKADISDAVSKHLKLLTAWF